MTVKFWKVLYRLAIKSRLYFGWSKLYQWLYESSYKKVWVARNLKPAQILDALERLRWTGDAPRQLWGAISSPRFVQHMINDAIDGRTTARAGVDCDEFSIWAVNALESRYNPRFLNLAYRTRSGRKVTGHNFCVATHPDYGIFLFSNWGKMGFYKTLNEAITDVLKLKDAELIGWFLTDRDLNLLDMDTKLSIKGEYNGSL